MAGTVVIGPPDLHGLSAYTVDPNGPLVTPPESVAMMVDQIVRITAVVRLHLPPFTITC